MNVNFGAGTNKLTGFSNHDIEMDVRKLPLQYADNSVDMVFTEHMPEHLTGPECLRFFEDVHRMLKVGGMFRVCVPVIGTWLQRDHARDLIVGHGHLIMLNKELIETVLWVAGFESDQIKVTDRKWFDGHHRVIGDEKDRIETLRVEAYKTRT